MTYPDAHLQSAIRNDERKYTFRCSLEDCPVYLKPYLISSPIPRESVNIYSENQYGNILSEVYNPNINPLKWVKRYLPSAFEVSMKVVKQTLESLVPKLSLPPLQSDNYICRLISICTIWEDVRSQMQSLLLSKCKWIPSHRPIGVISKYYISGKFLLGQISGIWYVFSYDQIMMISDTVWARCNVLMYHHLLPTCLTSKIPTVYIETCYSIVDSNFVTWGNDIYDGIKTWESIVLGLLVEDYDSYDGGREFLNPVLQEMREFNFNFVQTLHDYIKSLKLLPDQYSELHGLYRHWGHPTVDEIGACEKTRKISQHRPVPDFNTIIDSIGCLKRQYIISFIQRHGRWPLITNEASISNASLKNMVQSHARHLNLYQSTIKLQDWYSLELGQEMHFDHYADYTELLDDKAISPYRNEFRSLFNPTVLKYKPPKSKRSRRLLRAILELSHLSIEEIIIKIRLRQVPHEWFIVILHSKERELKIKPRLFAMMVLEMRMYFVVTEKNIANNVFPYFPQQTMTLSEAELTKRIYKFTEVGEIKSYIPFYVMIDFKSWNIHWSEMSTFDAFQFLDSIQGVPGLYTFTHEFFSKSLMVLSSSLLPPSSVVGQASRIGDPIECDTLWYDHLGGWDGLRQKGWTISTIALLLLVEHRTGIQSQIVGQADNQICKILIPRESNELSNQEYITANLKKIKEKINLFTSTLDSLVSSIGLVLKKEESLVSSVLTIYGKEMTLNGAHLSQASKKISRALAEVNISVPSLYSKVLTIHSAGLGTAQKTHTPFIPCILANVLSLISFINGARYSQLTRSKNPRELWDWIEGENALTFLLIGSSDAGGMPIQNILDYLYRGHPDSLTSYTTYLHTLAYHNKLAKRLYLYLQQRKYHMGEADPELLVSNPCSTNISSFPLVAARYRRRLETLVQRRTKNKDLRALFPKTSQHDDKQTFEFLLKFRPIQPRLIHEIFRLTPTCSRLTFLAKFSNTRTVHSMLEEERLATQEFDGDWDSIDYPMPAKIDIVVDDIDIGMLVHLRNTYNTIRAISEIDIPLICPTLLAKDMRQHSWKSLIGEESLDGVTIPHPAHQFLLSFPKPGSHTSCQQSLEHCVFTSITMDPKHVLSTRGTLPPYIGSRTREKLTGKIYSIPTTARPFKAAERAVILDDWCVDPTSSLHLFLNNIVESRTDIHESELRKVAGRISGGTSIHRLDSHMGPTSTLNNSLANYTTHILFSTDTMGRFSQGKENYVIHFQGVIHTGLSLLNIYIAHQNIVPLVAHLHYSGHCCEELIDESLVGGFFDIPIIPKFPDNPLLYTKVESLKTLNLETLRGILIENHQDSSWALSFILLSRIRTRILSAQWGVTETSAPTVSSLGVQEILRIGVERIIKSLAKLLYLHIDYEDVGLDIFLQSLSYDIWGDMSSIVLIPDVLVPTMEYLNLDGIPDAFVNPNHIARCLNRALINEVSHFHLHPHKLKKILPFHIYGNLKITHILRMWGKMIFLSTNGSIDIRRIIRIVTSPIHLASETVAHPNLSSNIILEVIKEYGVKGFEQIWKINPLRICYIPPETLLRIDPFPVKKELELFKPYTTTYISREPYILSLTYPPRSDILEITSCTYFPHNIPIKQKLRMDHMYRSIGQVSTAYLKYLEIVFKESIPLQGRAICTADGESSLGFLLYKLTGNAIIYNSLVPRAKLQPQRGYTYIPGSFLRYPQGILNAEVNSLYGGDITNTNIQDAIIECALSKQEPICTITCDAESSIEFSLNLTVRILLSVCRIAYHVKAQSAIIKTYAIDHDVMAKLGGHLQLIWEDVKLITPCFSSYESKECFWVCKCFNPVPGLDDRLQLWNLYGKITVPLSASQIMPHLIEFMEERSNYTYPFQQGKVETTKWLLSSAKKLGFRSNIIQAFYAITNNLIHYDNGISLEKNLKLALDTLLKGMYDYLKGIQRVYEGKPLELETGALVARGKVIHSNIESYIVSYRNIILTFKLTNHLDNPPLTNKLVHDFSMTKTPIHDARGKILYRYSDNDENEWRLRYLKSIWKIVGALVEI